MKLTDLQESIRRRKERQQGGGWIVVDVNSTPFRYSINDYAKFTDNVLEAYIFDEESHALRQKGQLDDMYQEWKEEMEDDPSWSEEEKMLESWQVKPVRVTFEF